VTGDALSYVLFAVRTALNITALLTAGLALHAALGVVERSAFARLRVRVIAVAIGFLLATLGRLAVLNLQMGDGANLFDPDLFALSWAALGPSTLSFGVGAITICAGLLVSSRLLMLAGALLLPAGFALTGHAQGLTDPGLAPLGVWAHGLIAAFWVAAPLTLYPAVSLSDEALHHRLTRFSTIAVAAIPLLVLLGVWLGWLLTGGGATLLTSSYGRLLLLKLTVGLGAMAAGAVNKQIITARVLTDPPTGRRWLRWTLSIETTLFLAAVIAVSAATTIAGPSE
jgi:putative copper export protein